VSLNIGMMGVVAAVLEAAALAGGQQCGQFISRVTAPENNRPLMDLLRSDLVLVRGPGRDQVLSGEPLHCREVGADGLGRLLLGPKIKVSAVDHGLELAGIKVALVAAAGLVGRFP
jgi:hypothetical protein